MKYSKNVLQNKNHKDKRIPGTVFVGGAIETAYHASSNKVVNPITNMVSMTLKYKLGEAIVDTKKEGYTILYGEKDGKTVLMGCFLGGSKNNYEYFLLDYAEEKFMATNIYSHFLGIMLLALERFVNRDGELDKYFRMLDLSVPIIDANQKKPFFIVADNLDVIFSEMIYERNFVEENDREKYYDPCLSMDITGFANESYRSIYTVQLAEAIIEQSTYRAMSVVYPDKKQVMTKYSREKNLKDRYYNGVDRFDCQSLLLMPELLKNGYQMARASFIKNRDFFTLQEWELIDAIYCGDVRNINFTGPAGTGKTTTIRSIAGALGMPFVLVGGSANIEESDLLGCREIESQDGVSVTTWCDGPITSAIRYGAFLLFDEINAADPGVIMKLNTVLDGSRTMILSSSESVNVHPNFVFAEAMNVGSAYAGTDQLNESHIDRMDEIFKIHSKTAEEEARIISSATGYDNMDNLIRMCQVKKYINQLIEEEGDVCEQICSPRRLICWAKKARRTGEFIESSLTTVIAHLCLYDDSLKTLNIEEIQESSGIVSSVMNRIIEEFKDVDY